MFWSSFVLVFISIFAEGEGHGCWNQRRMQSLVKKITCEKPLVTLIRLRVPDGYDSVYPSVTLAKRCSGKMCASATEECVATHYINKTITVEGAKDRREIHWTDCVKIEYQEDTKCTCRCIKKPEDCEANEIYNRALCKCVCDAEEEERCKDSNLYMWDSKTCTCKCTREEECDVGSVWVTKLCRCVTLHGVHGLPLLPSFLNEVREDADKLRL